MVHTVETVKAKIAELKLSDVMFAGKEIKALPGILKPNEVLLAATKGWYKNGVGLLCATASRIIFINKGIFSLKVEEFSLKSVSSISSETGLITAKIKIFASGNNAEIEQAPKPDAKRFVDEVSKMLEAREQPRVVQEVSNNQQKSNEDIYEQLEKLAALKDKGIVTEEEFLAKKAQLLKL